MTPEFEASRKRRSSILPREVGTRFLCCWRDGKYHPVKVIECRKMHYAQPNDYEYYVHHTEFNRRLDEWVKLEQLDLGFVEAVVDEKVEDKVTYPTLRQQAWSLDDLTRTMAFAMHQGSMVTSMDFHPSHHTLLLGMKVYSILPPRRT